jgi:hypothetical protein
VTDEYVRAFQAGDTPIVLDDVAGIAQKAGDVIMEIYNGTSEEVRDAFDRHPC